MSNAATSVKVASQIADSETLSAGLTGFGTDQFSGIPISEITQNTATLIAACSFLAGGLKYMAEQSGANREEYFKTLSDYICKTFNMNERNAMGLVDSNERLFHKYQLIENAYSLGYQAAGGNPLNKDGAGEGFRKHFEKYRRVTMSDLGVDGIKIRPTEPFGITNETTTENQRQSTSRFRRVFQWAAVVIILLVVNVSLVWLLKTISQR